MQLPLHNEMSNDELATVFSFVADVLNMDARNKYRARAYEEAGVVIQQLNYELYDAFQKLQTENVETAITEFTKQLDALPGIGESISKKLVELFTTGTITSFQKYVADLPAGMYPLVQLYGLGAKKSFKLATHFKLNNAATAIAQVLTAAKAGQVQELEGFGEKSEQDLIEILETKHQKSRIPYADALAVAEQLQAALEKSPEIKKVSYLGSLRRQAATVGDIDMGIAVADVTQVKKYIEGLSFVKRILVAGDNMIRVVVEPSWQVDIKVAPLAEWGSFIQHFTGSKEHNIKLREFALKKGLSLSEHGIKTKSDESIKTFVDEAKFYNYLGLQLIPPAERTGGNELEKYLL